MSFFSWVKKIAVLGLVFGSSTVFAAAAPDFTLKSSTGENIRLAEQRGQVVMLNFWASWCGPCRDEMPLLDKLNSKYGKMGFVLYGVNTDQDIAEAKKVLEKVKVNYPILFDPDSKLSDLYAVDSMPFSVFIDKKGQIRHIHKGYVPGDDEKYIKQIKELISE
ncbi:thiol:disulfide interchange protein [Cellvibrio zantedeschiae]|uniref:Thiol:disulfide interchange protein n=1 Tax=Cellvibrio zantedeschiae TaxID=1237077 RepID=A0ABQ3BAG4_9GAMM|nr:TlpA disulfide reductase family protein [Cellvibrio zantedeschiae]GGY87854.1 thiol:disulfide interchange protein [Cellvibrio zantedeschiae]